MAATAIRLCFRPNRILFQNLASSLHFHSTSSIQIYHARKNELQKVEPNKNAVSDELKTESARIHSYVHLNDGKFLQSDSESESESESEQESDVEEKKRDWKSFRRFNFNDDFVKRLLGEDDDDFAGRFRRWSMHIESSREMEDEIKEMMRKEEEEIMELFTDMEDWYKVHRKEKEQEWEFLDHHIWDLSDLKKGLEHLRRDGRKMIWWREEKEKDRLQLLRKLEEASRVRLVFEMEIYEKMKLLLQMGKMERLNMLKALCEYGSKLTHDDITKMRAAAKEEQDYVKETIGCKVGFDMHMVGMDFECYPELCYSSDDDYDKFGF